MHYYPFHLKDYLVETAHLPPMADLAYRRLLDLYYKTEEPIRNEPKWVANRIRLDTEERVIGFVLKEYFKLDRDVDPPVWRHKTCDEVISKYQKKAATARENGGKHLPGTKKQPKSDADGKLTKNHKPRTKNTPLPPEGALWFDEFWKTYPRTEGKPAALKAFTKALAAAPSFQAIMDGLKRYIGCDQWTDPTKIPHASTWLNREGWNDIPPAAAADGKAGQWWDSRVGIEKQGMGFGLPAPPRDNDAAWFEFMAAVWLAAGDGPWIDESSRAYPIFKRLRNGDEA
jgi:uncharacterized protein YdaU (DUF1376 family)